MKDQTSSTIEIMAPVGSFEALEAAIKAGADSVYFGVGNMNMRAAMQVNFSEADLPRIAEICDRHDVKSYLALNIIIYDDELDEMRRLVDKAKASNITAIIGCDHAVLMYCQSVGMAVHISTQANVSNIEEVKYYSSFADTMVLGRELTLAQIAHIAREIQERQIKGPAGHLVRIEIFVHGYFCMAISGKCLLSLHTYNAPANRGECKAPCQRKYIVKDAGNDNELFIDNEYILSAKDLCTIDFIDKIIKAGVSVFKIEGRKKSVDYVYTTTKCYKEAADAYFNGSYTQEKINKWRMELATVINRGFWGGYYLGNKLNTEWSTAPANRIVKEKTYIGKGVGYIESEKRGEFKLENAGLRQGDDILIVDRLAGVFQETAKELRINGKEVEKVEKGAVFSLPVPQKITKSTQIYKVEFEKYNPLLAFCSKAFASLFGHRVYNSVRQLLLRNNDN